LRLKLAFTIGGKEFSFGAKSLSPGTQAFLNGTDTDDSSRGAMMVTPYAQSAWVYCAVSILAQSVAQIPFRISRVAGGKAKKVRALRSSSDPLHRKLCRRALGEDILASGDVVDLFNRPHPTMDAQMFFEMLVTWLSLRGEFFVLPLDGADQPVDLSERKPRIKRLLTLPPEMFWHVVQGYDLAAWRYTGSPLMSPIASEMLLPSEVIQSKLPNPYLYWRGLSPLNVAMTPAATDYAGEQFQKGLWLNNADTGVVVTTDQILGDDQRRAIESALRERKRKAGTPDRPLFLFGGAKVEKPTLTMMDMQFLETRKFLRQEIFAILKVPETLAGFTADLNDGGAGGSLDAQKASFIESTIGSLCNRIETAFTPVVTTFGDDLVGWFDIDSLPIMQAARQARWDTGTKMFAMGVPINDVNTNLDLGLPEYAWGNKSFLPFNLQEVGADGLDNALPSEDAAAATAAKTDEAKSNPFTRLGKFLASLKAAPVPVQKELNFAAIWKRRIAARKASVNLVKGKVAKVLFEYRKKALAKLDEVHLQKDFAEVSKRGLVDMIFAHQEFGKSLNDQLQAPLAAMLQSAGEEMMAEIGHTDPWKYPPKGVLEFLAARKQPIMDTGETVRSQINTTLVEGTEAGETHDELAARVKAVFTEMSDSEARRVARTEVNIGYNAAQHQALIDAGIEFKQWLGSHGPRSRAGHIQAEEDYSEGGDPGPIPVDEPFEVQNAEGFVEKLMFPGDDSLGASASNICNCECGVLAAAKTGDDGKTLTFKIFGVGEIKILKK
jgi:HK97 family phage portal protein